MADASVKIHGFARLGGLVDRLQDLRHHQRLLGLHGQRLSIHDGVIEDPLLHLLHALGRAVKEIHAARSQIRLSTH